MLLPVQIIRYDVEEVDMFMEVFKIKVLEVLV
jgi:hypothetical protein